jgi:glycosyltransferase involved in cell wall biosynthesis
MEKIVQLSSVHISSDTRIFHKICKSLVNNGYKVDLIIQHAKDEIVDGISIVALPIATKKIQRLTKILPAVLKKVIKYSKNTIIHFHDPELIPFGIIFKLLGYKVIYDVHEDVPIAILPKKWIPFFLKPPLATIIKVIERISAFFFDANITVVPTITERFAKSNRKTVEIRNYPILREELAEVNKSNHTSIDYVTYVGSLTETRGILQIVDAMNYIDEECIELWLGGDFGEEDLRQELEKNNGWEKTKYLGWLNREKVNKILKNAFAGMVVLNHTPSHESSLPVKLYEYMMAGIPVIATNFPLWKEIIIENNCGILVDPLNTHEIAEAIKWLYNHPKEAKLMGENGRKAVIEKYNWHSEEKKLLKLYETINS